MEPPRTGHGRLAAGLEGSAYRPGPGDIEVGSGLDHLVGAGLVTTWENVGSYRRALSSYDVKLHAVGLLGRAIDEPSAFEVVEPGTVLNIGAPRSLG